LSQPELQSAKAGGSSAISLKQREVGLKEREKNVTTPGERNEQRTWTETRGTCEAGGQIGENDHDGNAIGYNYQLKY